MNPMLRLRSLLLVAVLLCTWGISANGQCLPSWLYRAKITITNTTGNTLTDFQTKVILNTQIPISQGKMRADGGDIRFVQNPDGGCLMIDHWLEGGMNSDATVYWLKVPALLGGSTDFYVYYGNPAATSASNPNNVFPIFDDFNGSDIDPAKWNRYSSGSMTVGGGQISINSNGVSATLRSVPSIGTPAVAEMNVVSASGNWPNLAQVNEGTWNGYTTFLGGGTMWAGRTEGGPWPDYQAYLQNSAGAGNVSGVWTTIWVTTGQQIHSWPSGTINRTGTDYAIGGTVQMAFGCLESGTGSITVDWARMRKYASPEPTSLIGPEEVIAPPVITSQPQNVTVCAGEPASFSVEATGQFLTYQWRRNGVNISGANASTYTIPATTPAHAGIYDVVVRNQVVSNPATLTVNTQAGILEHPVDVEPVCPGSPITFRVVAAGGGLTYQWRKNGSDIPGAVAPSYTIPAAMPTDIGDYDVVVSGVCGVPVTSESATFGLLQVPLILEQPGNQTVCRGQVATFRVNAIGEDLTYQWRRNGQPIEGATFPTLEITAQPYSAATYDVVITGTCNPPAISEPSMLTVTLDPIITEQPLDRTVQVGQPVSFRVRTMGGGILSYTWQKDGVTLPGRVSDTLWIPSVGVDDIGDYNVVIRGTTCAFELTVSNKASLLLDAPPAIVKDPQDEVLCEGDSAVLTVTAAGTGLTYQWQKNGVNIPGATGRDLRIDSALADDAGAYRVVIKGANNITLTSGQASVTVNQAAAIATQPNSVTVCPGQPANFVVTATGTGLTYQWRKNGVNIDGATSATYAITAAAAADSGTYDVVIGGTCTDSISSVTANLALNEMPVITQQPQAVSVGLGQPITLTVAATGTNITYQWRKDGANIPGATSAVYNIPAATLDHAGNYDVVITGLCEPAATSTAVAVNVSTSSVPGDPTFGAGAMLTVVPHPAKGLTTLQLHLPQGINARQGSSLMLFDVNGKLVLDLSDNFANGGFKSAEFDAASLSSGTYYCRLTTPNWNGTVGTVVVQK